MERLAPGVSLGLAAGTAALVVGTYQHFLPNVIDNRTMGFNDPHIATSERQAAWTSAAIVGGVSLLAKDPMIFIVGGAVLVALSWFHRHANLVMPDGTTSAVPASPDNMAAMSQSYEPHAG